MEKGFQQRRGIDFNATYAQVVKLSLIHLVLAYAHTHALVSTQVGVKNAFHNGKIDEEIYMRQPEGLVNNRRSNYVCKLEKRLYGLKQSARGFHTGSVRHLNSYAFAFYERILR